MTMPRPGEDVQLVQLFLPLYTPDGSSVSSTALAKVRLELTERFGGVTCFVAAPAQGRWEDAKGHVRNDELVLFEVMTGVLDTAWWRQYREDLQQRFHQELVLVRSLAAHVL
jgi:hypothetical protein